MNCPRCAVELLPSIREDIEIDCCPRCGGIWLDHGELHDMIAAYAAQMEPEIPRKTSPQAPDPVRKP